MLNISPLPDICFAGPWTDIVKPLAVADRMLTSGEAPLVVLAFTTLVRYAEGHLRNAVQISPTLVKSVGTNLHDCVHPEHLSHLKVVHRLMTRMPPPSPGDLPAVIVVVDADTPLQMAHDFCAWVKSNLFSRPVGLLRDGMDAIGQINPHLVTQDPPSYTYYAGLAMIRDGLFLGDRVHASDPLLVWGNKIGAVVNCTVNHPNTFDGKGVHYLRVPLYDDGDANISKYFGVISAFIGSAIGKGCNVLVHCQAGISRSATAVIAYLMQSEEISYVEALDDVRSKRPIVSPNLGFSEQLRNFETQLREGVVPVAVAPPPPPPSPVTPPSTSPSPATSPKPPTTPE